MGAGPAGLAGAAGADLDSLAGGDLGSSGMAAKAHTSSALGASEERSLLTACGEDVNEGYGLKGLFTTEAQRHREKQKLEGENMITRSFDEMTFSVPLC